jgi:hypothetical protein
VAGGFVAVPLALSSGVDIPAYEYSRTARKAQVVMPVFERKRKRVDKLHCAHHRSFNFAD